MTLQEAKARLDAVIGKARVDMYKPIQAAEALRFARCERQIDFSNVAAYKNESLRWRDVVSLRLLGKKSTSSAQFQHNVWDANAMEPRVMMALDTANQADPGCVEAYIYRRVAERTSLVGRIVAHIRSSTPADFRLEELLNLFIAEKGLRRSVDKAFEIVTYALLETVVTALGTRVTVEVPEPQMPLLREFEDLATMLLGVSVDAPTHTQMAHLYRVGVTNAADRGLDMWANFGPAVQVKHLTIDADLAHTIVDQVESDHIVVVCKACEAEVIAVVAKQIGWGRRVRAIVTERHLSAWYEKCLRGKFADVLGKRLLEALLVGFATEFPQNNEIGVFMRERGYPLTGTGIWL